jgi:hypothetical protein
MTTVVALAIIGLILLMVFQKIKFHLEWKQVYTAIGYEQYYKYTNELTAKGIPCRTRTPIGSQRNGEGILSYDATQYNIYVKKKDVHKISGTSL